MCGLTWALRGGASGGNGTAQGGPPAPGDKLQSWVQVSGPQLLAVAVSYRVAPGTSVSRVRGGREPVATCCRVFLRIRSIGVNKAACLEGRTTGLRRVALLEAVAPRPHWGDSAPLFCGACCPGGWPSSPVPVPSLRGGGRRASGPVHVREAGSAAVLLRLGFLLLFSRRSLQ